MKKNRLFRFLFGLFAFLFILGNIISYNHAYQFTHFSQTDTQRTAKPEELSLPEIVKTLFWGVSIPKSQNDRLPTRPYETVYLQSHERLEGWLIETESKSKLKSEKGMVILYHGYSSCKSGMLNYSDQFNEQGYATFLIDFMGNGGSEGHQTTIGYKESRDVKVAYDFIKEKYKNVPIYLFGSSMGAVAIMKAITEEVIAPDAIVIECPFGTMVQTTQARFKAMNLPGTPFAHILLAYGGIQNGINPFKHKPIEYAKEIELPALLLHGKKDKRVSVEEVQQIYANIPTSKKKLVLLENSGHEPYLVHEKENWTQNVFGFLKQVNN